MTPITELSHLTNPLVAPQQLEVSISQLDGVPRDVEDSIRYETARLLQAAGVLLRLPQEIIASSIVILQRVWVSLHGSSLMEHSSRDVAAAALYLYAKPTASLQSTRQILTVMEYLDTLRPNYNGSANDADVVTSSCLSEGDLQSARERLYALEAHILRVLGFETHVALPYSLMINYLQALEVFTTSDGSKLAKRAFAYLNGALLSPQMLYVTHQPTALATAAIYLAARDITVKLPEVEWWEVFDVDREELGFLVVALQSLEGFAQAEKEKWGHEKVPLTVEGLQVELEKRSELDVGH